MIRSRRRPVVAAAFLVATLLFACTPPDALRRQRAAEEDQVLAEDEKAAEFPVVLSVEAVDSGRTLTEDEAIAEFTTNLPPLPDDFRMNTVIVAEGLGSFQVATPTRYSRPWRYGTSFDELLTDAEARDPGWAEFWSTRLDDDENPRAVLLDMQSEDEVVAIIVTATDAPGQSGEEMAQLFSELYSDIGSVSEAHSVRVNGEDGAYVEYSVPAQMVGGAQDRIQAQVLIPDEPNGILWGLTCDIPAALLSRLKPECAEMAKTFKPLPSIAGHTP